jgi:predicted RNA-binding protein (virulence factor B family)
MSLSSALGRSLTLTVMRFAPPGAYLYVPVEGQEAGPEDEVVLLPRGELPEDLKEGDMLEAFLYLDSEDRLTATLETPFLSLDEVAFLEVKDVNRFGAFVDIGLRKELLVPFAEQTRPLRPGDVEPIGLIRDRTGRLCGTMRIRELFQDGSALARDAWLTGEAWRKEPGVGVFVILARRYLGLVPNYEPSDLQRGESARFRVSHVLPDGRIELSLRGHRHEELAGDGDLILKVLREKPELRISDHSTPEQIRALFGLSKKAFKRAVGGLLKRGEAGYDARGVLCAAPER